MDPSFLKLFYADMKEMGINKSIQSPETKEYEEWELPTHFYEPPVTVSETMQLQGKLTGHSKPITCIRATFSENTNMIISGSSDKTVIVWNVDSSATKAYGEIKSQFKEHNATVTDITVSADEQYAITSSMDASGKLWKISNNEFMRDFNSTHTQSIVGVVLSPDNRQIITIGKDNIIAVWNTIGVLKYKQTIPNDEWFSCITVSPNIYEKNEIKEVYPTGGNELKFWHFDENFKFTQKRDAFGHLFASKGDHKSGITAITISPDGSLIATADEKGLICIWDAMEQKMFYSLKAKCGAHKINDVIFSPTRYWVCFAIWNVIEIWDLESKANVAVLVDNEYLKHSMCMCISWSANGNLLYSGHSDNMIRIWKVKEGYSAEEIPM